MIFPNPNFFGVFFWKEQGNFKNFKNKNSSLDCSIFNIYYICSICSLCWQTKLAGTKNSCIFYRKSIFSLNGATSFLCQLRDESSSRPTDACQPSTVLFFTEKLCIGRPDDLYRMQHESRVRVGWAEYREREMYCLRRREQWKHHRTGTCAFIGISESS